MQFLEGKEQNIRRQLKQGESNEYSVETYREASLQVIAAASALGNEKKAKKMTKRYYKHFGNEKWWQYGQLFYHNIFRAILPCRIAEVFDLKFPQYDMVFYFQVVYK